MDTDIGSLLWRRKSLFKYFIGIDLITKRIQKAVTKSQKRNLLNISFLKADAIEFISAINDDMKLRNIYIMFPDPWPMLDTIREDW